MKPSPKLSAAEWEVMKVVWDHPASAAREIVTKLAEQKDWHPRTVKTLLARLVKKGAMAYEIDGNRYLYTPNIKKEALVKKEGHSFVQRVFDGVTVPMLAHFVKTTKLTREEIRQLKRILLEKERGDGDT
ncbi:MAG: BlaI/MecI/CopY family transcriptional regulator [bacterium]